MKIIIRNKAQIPKKYVRFIKWKLLGIKEKFNHLLYAEVFLDSEGQNPKTCIVTIRLGIPGNDIIIQNKAASWKDILNKSTKAVHRYLVKKKSEEIDARKEMSY